MSENRWHRLAGLCVLTALTLQGVGVLATASDLGHGDRHDVAALALLPPDLPSGCLPALPCAGWLVEASPPPAVSAHPAPEPPRGPPA